ncbi:MAG: hypothetical protein GY765_39410, partial [bacterium]|nr:hypothetical protein [bacterium]
MKTKTRLKLVYLVTLCLWCCSFIQALDPGKPLSKYLLDQWGTKQGLPSDAITGIAQTPDGYLWIGTTRGLVRYDGVKQEVFVVNTIDSSSIFWNTGPLQVTSQGVLWMGWRYGMALYKDREFKTLSDAKNAPATPVGTIKEDSYGNLWAATANHLYLYRDGVFTSINQPGGLKATAIRQIFEDRKGILWLASFADGLYYGRQSKFDKYEIDGFDDYRCNTTFQDRHETLWVGTNLGLIQIENPLSTTAKKITLHTREDGLAHNIITDLKEDGDGNLWVGTEAGLTRLQSKADGTIIFHTDERLQGMMVNSLFIDREKCLWLGTQNSGLIRLKDGAINMLYKQQGVPLQDNALFADRDGGIWLGSSRGDLFRFDHSAGKLQLFARIGNDVAIAAISQDHQGNLWLASDWKGAYRITKNNQITNFSEKDGLVSNQLFMVFCDSRNRVWFASQARGLGRYADGVFSSFTGDDGLSDNIVFYIYEDRAQNIWVGTDKGMTILKGGQWDTSTNKNILKERSFNAVYQDSAGMFWVGTDNFGMGRLSFVDGDPFSEQKVDRFFYTDANGLGKTLVYQIMEDGMENLWLSSQDGIIKVNKKELNDFAAGTIDSIHSRAFGIPDGMLNIQCAQTLDSIIKTGDGEFWFSTRKGVAVVKPGEVKINKTPPLVVLEKIALNGKPLPVADYKRFFKDGGTKKFKGITSIHFYFTSPTFISPDRVTMSYKLEGYHEEWRTVRLFKERSAYYDNLPPGKYTFRVSAANSDGIRSEEDAVFRFLLTKHF